MSNEDEDKDGVEDVVNEGKNENNSEAIDCLLKILSMQDFVEDWGQVKYTTFTFETSCEATDKLVRALRGRNIQFTYEEYNDCSEFIVTFDFRPPDVFPSTGS
jgi:hypothetical protein